MGLFGFGTKTKSDWDKEIQSKNSYLAKRKADLAKYKAMYGSSQPALIAGIKSDIERLKAEIANAKIERKNAPKE